MRSAFSRPDVPRRDGRGEPWGRRAAALLLPAAVLLSGCGKQGPPLAPLTPQPARIADFTARRIGQTIFARFTIPSSNQDGTTPADIARVDVYAYTATAESAVSDLKDAEVVATVRVRRPPDPDAPDSRAKHGQAKDAKPGPAPKPRPPEPGITQGAIAVVTEPLTSRSLVPIAVRPNRAAAAREALIRAALEKGPFSGADQLRLLSRYYVAVGVSRHGRKSAPSSVAGIPLVPLPPSVTDPAATYGEKAIKLAWPTPQGLPRPVQEPPGDGDLKSRVLGSSQPPATGYNVYLVADAPPAALPADGSAPLPTPLNEKPLPAPAFDDDHLQFGQQRCYEVRTVETVGAAAIESEPSPRACVTPTDTFPPPVPSGLAAVASEGAISLIWEAVDAPDLAGYLVLRGEVDSGKLDPITPAPIKETTFRDTTARPGVRYVYAVVAVDTASPPNRSEPSNKVEESIR